jgi:hyperosmotically inducible periplasmic protein
MKTKLLASAVLVAATASLSACTTRPVTVDMPGSASATVPVPVLATADITLTNHVRANLESAMGSNAAGIEVRVEQQVVYLTGRVATRALHDQAVAVARGTANVRGVVHTGLIVG